MYLFLSTFYMPGMYIQYVCSGDIAPLFIKGPPPGHIPSGFFPRTCTPHYQLGSDTANTYIPGTSQQQHNYTWTWTKSNVFVVL